MPNQPPDMKLNYQIFYVLYFVIALWFKKKVYGKPIRGHNFNTYAVEMCSLFQRYKNIY